MKRWAVALTLLLPPFLFESGNALATDARAAILGEVKRPGSYELVPGERLSSLIARAGGFTDNAFLPGATLTRETAKGRDEESLRDAVARLEAGAWPGAADVRKKEEFTRLLTELVALGRIPVRLAHPRLLKGSEQDLPLESGDTLFVPSKRDVVFVTGAVVSGTTVLPVHEKAGYKEYIEKAGGFAREADRDHLYLLKADGTVQELSQEWLAWNPARSRWELSAFRRDRPGIEPGDTIVVPAIPAPGAWPGDRGELQRLLMRLHAITGKRVALP